jgi:hypothetical protein
MARGGTSLAPNTPATKSSRSSVASNSIERALGAAVVALPDGAGVGAADTAATGAAAACGAGADAVDRSASAPVVSLQQWQ